MSSVVMWLLRWRWYGNNSCGVTMCESWGLHHMCSAHMPDYTYVILQRVCSKDTNRERGGVGVLSDRPLSHVTYSGACTQPCSTPLSRNCCGCRHSPRIWSARTSPGSCRSASGAWRHGRGRSRPPGCTPLPEDSLLDHLATRGSTLFQSQLQTLQL